MDTSIKQYRTKEEIEQLPHILDKYRVDGMLRPLDALEKIVGEIEVVKCQNHGMWKFLFKSQNIPSLYLDVNAALMRYNHHVVDFFVYSNVLMHYELNKE